MPKADMDRRERFRRSQEILSKKLVMAFSVAVPELGKISETEGLSKEERQECVYALNMINRFNGGARIPGWPSVQIEEFLNIGSPFYEDQLTTFRILRIDTLKRLFKIPFSVIRGTFMKCGVRLPVIFEILHREFHRQAIPPPERHTPFLFDQKPKGWLRGFHTL